mmetsp:Transcript_44012/g.42596  ORF Transcript_44012/g.42596 Transcript_44012/m.42596 type:complete len:213 (-) Transcript_44012:939-1577(-)
MNDRAVRGWLDFYHPDPSQVPLIKVPVELSCYCQDQTKIYGFGIRDKEFSDMDNSSLKGKICGEWFWDNYYTSAFKLGVSLSINVVNSILKIVVIKVIAFICEDEKSAQSRSIQVAVFVMTFFNTALLLLLANANFSETHIPLVDKIFKGKYTDLHQNWYDDVGATLVQTMMINAVMPLAEFGGYWTMGFVFRLMDRSYSSDTYLSKTKSIQ